jgi:hypothetical protein
MLGIGRISNGPDCRRYGGRAQAGADAQEGCSGASREGPGEQRGRVADGAIIQPSKMESSWSRQRPRGWRPDHPATCSGTRRTLRFPELESVYALNGRRATQCRRLDNRRHLRRIYHLLPELTCVGRGGGPAWRQTGSRPRSAHIPTAPAHRAAAGTPAAVRGGDTSGSA